MTECEKWLLAFIAESNRIEGITRAPTRDEIEAHRDFIELGRITQGALETFVLIVADARIRDRVGMNVAVGSHRPPLGGRTILTALHAILLRANDPRAAPYVVHANYETLHPFMDGNGRSGRVLWLWQMLKWGHDPHVTARGFLHTWYYQSLTNWRP